jgi:hypothetical protein
VKGIEEIFELWASLKTLEKTVAGFFPATVERFLVQFEGSLGENPKLHSSILGATLFGGIVGDGL